MNLPVNYTELQPFQRAAVRNEYIRVQQGLCHHCDEPLSGQPSHAIQMRPVNRALFPDGFFKWAVHLHHDHKTGMTIGAVHARCNAVLWQYHGQ